MCRGPGWLHVLFVGLLVAAGGRAAEPAAPGVEVKIWDVGPGVHEVPRILDGQPPNVWRIAPTVDLADTRHDFGDLKENFVTQLTGRLTVPASGSYVLRLTSDDGALLWLNGRLLIDHDGFHPPTAKERALYLYQGFYDLRVDHFQGGGGAAVKLEWRGPADAGFVVVPADGLSCRPPEKLDTAPGRKKMAPRLTGARPDVAPVDGVHPGFELRSLRPAGYEPRVSGLAWLAAGALAVTDRAGGQQIRLTGALEPDSAQTAVAPLAEPVTLPAATQVAAAGEGDRCGRLLGAAPDQRGALLAWLPPEVIVQPTHAATAPAGVYQGQVFVGDMAGGGVKRVALESVGGRVQGALLKFTQGLEAGVSQLLWAPDGSLIIGGDGGSAAWGEFGKPGFGLQRLKPRAQPAFDLLAVRARSNGFELAFTAPLAAKQGWDAPTYRVTSWAVDGEGRRGDEQRLAVTSATVSANRTQVFLELPDLRPQRVIYLRLPRDLRDEAGRPLWTNEAWYSLFQAGPQPGLVQPAPDGTRSNTLTAAEQQAGWRTLFDGRTPHGLRGFRRKEFPARGWEVVDGTLHSSGGGDLVTLDDFDSFEFQLDWKATKGANSGVMYRVSEEVSPSWYTGPEVQILDDGQPSSTEIHSACACYELYPPHGKRLNPPGEWNHLLLVVRGSHVEHWLNGVQVCSYELGSEDWRQRVAKSKFKELPRFGTERTGKICIQDHGSELWFRNLKVRAIPAG